MMDFFAQPGRSTMRVAMNVQMIRRRRQRRAESLAPRTVTQGQRKQVPAAKVPHVEQCRPYGRVSPAAYDAYGDGNIAPYAAQPACLCARRGSARAGGRPRPRAILPGAPAPLAHLRGGRRRFCRVRGDRDDSDAEVVYDDGAASGWAVGHRRAPRPTTRRRCRCSTRWCCRAACSRPKRLPSSRSNATSPRGSIDQLNLSMTPEALARTRQRAAGRQHGAAQSQRRLVSPPTGRPTSPTLSPTPSWKKSAISCAPRRSRRSAISQRNCPTPAAMHQRRHAAGTVPVDPRVRRRDRARARRRLAHGTARPADRPTDGRRERSEGPAQQRHGTNGRAFDHRGQRESRSTAIRSPPICGRNSPTSRRSWRRRSRSTRRRIRPSSRCGSSAPH